MKTKIRAIVFWPVTAGLLSGCGEDQFSGKNKLDPAGDRADVNQPVSITEVSGYLSQEEIVRLETVWLSSPGNSKSGVAETDAREALRKLMQSGHRDAVKSVMKVFELPAEAYFSDDADDRKSAVGHIKHVPYDVMGLISWYVEETPPPVSEYHWTMKDIPVWRDWWRKNSGTFRLKERPGRDSWIKERGIVKEP